MSTQVYWDSNAASRVAIRPGENSSVNDEATPSTHGRVATKLT